MTLDRRRDGMGLTPRAVELLIYIQTRDLCPSVDEMRRALGLASKSGIIRLLEQLEGRGYIRRLHKRARAIEVLHASPRHLPKPRLRVVLSPEELAGRAAFKRRMWANEDRKAGRG